MGIGCSAPKDKTWKEEELTKLSVRELKAIMDRKGINDARWVSLDRIIA